MRRNTLLTTNWARVSCGIQANHRVDFQGVETREVHALAEDRRDTFEEEFVGIEVAAGLCKRR